MYEINVLHILMESVQLNDKLEDFYNRFILSIYSKDFNFCIELMENQVDKNQASAMVFFP